MKQNAQLFRQARCVAALLVLLALAACAPPVPTSPRPTAAVVLDITVAPTQDVDATATAYARQLVPTPTPAGLYVVQQGDTLGGLAEDFGTTVEDLMAANGWRGADTWAEHANDLAPTLVGGSKQGGADLGPTRSRAAWAKLGVEGKSLADEAPSQDFIGMPRLTIPMVARLQGFPDGWHFAGKKTHTYRQVGNALPPQLAKAVARQIKRAIIDTRRERAFAAKHGRVAW